MTPDQPSIDELRQEFARADVRGWIWSWLREHLLNHASNRICGRLKPRVYSPSGEWDAAGLNDVVNEFIVERGIRRGAIAKSLAAARDTVDMLRYLEKAFRRFVISDRPRSLTRNIFDRLRDVLDQRTDFIRLEGVPPYSFYGLADWEDDPPPKALDDSVRDAARFLPTDIAWVTYSSGTRQSPGISSHDLERIVHALLAGVGLLLSARQIMLILQQRFALHDEIADATSDPLASVATPTSNPLEVLEATDLASRALEAFSARQRNIVKLMIEDPAAISVRDVAAKLDISKSTAATELRAIQGRFRLLGASTDDIQRQILDALGLLLRAG